MRPNARVWHYSWAQIASLLTSILNAFLIARILSVEQYGGYSLILKSTNIATIIFSLGVASSIQNNPGFLISNWRFFFTFIVSVTILQSIAVYIYSNYALHDVLLSCCAVILGVTNLLILIIANYEIAVEESKKLIFTRSFTPIILSICLSLISMFSLHLFSKSFEIVLLIAILNAVVIISRFKELISYSVGEKNSSLRQQVFTKSEILDFFEFGLKSFPAVAIRSFHLSLDLLLLGLLMNPRELSEYAICITVGGISSLPMFVVSTDKQVIFKKISLIDGRLLIYKRFFCQLLPISLFWSAIVFFVVLATNGDLFFSISRNAMLILIILIFANLIDGIVLIYSLLAISNGFNSESTRIQSAGFIINLVAMIILVPKFLGLGAAIASLLSYTFCAVLLHRRIR